MAFCEIEEQMELSELKKLTKAMKGYGLASIILNMLWVNFSEIQAATCLNVHDGTVSRFKGWLKSGDEGDAWS